MEKEKNKRRRRRRRNKKGPLVKPDQYLKLIDLSLCDCKLR